MIRMLRVLGVCLLLAACAHAPSTAKRPLTVLVSIDGFAPGYLDLGVTPTLSRLAREGALASMRPSFPSKTFPNHYTLVTGLRPDRHGIVDNNMLDPEIPGVTFRLADKAVANDPRWWSEGEPIWVTAEKAGLRTATMFWPGSEVAIRGVRPTHWRPYDQTLSAQARVDQALAWLEETPDTRFLTLYFDEVDTEGHHHGPRSPEVEAALATTDAAVGKLVAGLAARGIAANLVVVSDHGMAATPPGQRIFLDDLMPLDAGRTLTLGAFVTLYPAEGRTQDVERALLRPHPHLSCWRKAEIPARYHFGRHRRVAPIFCLSTTGWTVTTRDAVARQRQPELGAHGFDPFAPEMAAVFIGHGPAFRARARPETFDNVDVYPLLARLVGVRPEANDGDLDQLGAALKP
jgi:predicted AlkP superfamily pyrophosphatase or phosphodiesterase